MRHFVYIATVLVAFTAEPGSASGETPSNYRTLTVGATEREWSLFVPSSYDASRPVPLVLEFHGTGSTPQAQQRLSDFPALADREGFIIVAPKAAYARSGDGWLTWNVDLLDDGNDDVEFIDELIDHVAENYAIDESRVYATGFSGGARMSSRLACDLSHRIAAIGPVGGIRYPEDCAPTRPVPVITFHGRQDNVNHYEHQPDSPDYWRMGVEDALAGWVSGNDCDASATETVLSESDTRLDYSTCSADVVFYRSETASHTWPGSPLAGDMFDRWKAVTADLPATSLIWSFFKSHPMPSVATQ